MHLVCVSECFDCPRDTYKDVPGKGACLTCATGLTTGTRTGQTECLRKHGPSRNIWEFELHVGVRTKRDALIRDLNIQIHFCDWPMSQKSTYKCTFLLHVHVKLKLPIATHCLFFFSSENHKEIALLSDGVAAPAERSFAAMYRRCCRCLPSLWKTAPPLLPNHRDWLTTPPPAS